MLRAARRLGLDDADAELVVAVLERSRARSRSRAIAAIAPARSSGRLDLVLDEPVQDHQLGRRRAEVGAQACVVALVLLQLLGEPVPLRLGQLQRSSPSRDVISTFGMRSRASSSSSCASFSK